MPRRSVARMICSLAQHPDSSDIIVNSVIALFASELDKYILSALRSVNDDWTFLIGFWMCHDQPTKSTIAIATTDPDTSIGVPKLMPMLWLLQEETSYGVENITSSEVCKFIPHHRPASGGSQEGLKEP
eukprot:scaffold25579_cov94-Skeletonema_dohrnii-CCMP3373.AAC.1